MRSDTKALLKVFGWSFVVAIVVMGIAAAAALGWLNRDHAVYLMLGGIIVGGVVIGRWLGPSLRRRPSGTDRPARPSATVEEHDLDPDV